jgi:hypothetical protein
MRQIKNQGVRCTNSTNIPIALEINRMNSKLLPKSEEEKKPSIEKEHWLAKTNIESILAGLILLFILCFNLVRFSTEVTIRAPFLNDGVLHRIALIKAEEAVSIGNDPTDIWVSTIALGYPLFHYYQQLPYVIPAILTFTWQAKIDPSVLLSWTSYLLLSLFPLSIYWSMRKLGFNALTAAWSGVAASMLSTNGLYGFDVNSYLWGGYGLYTQLWGMFLLPPTLAQGYLAIKTRRGIFWSVLLLAATILSHLVYGYIAIISLAVFIFLPYLGRMTATTGTNLGRARLKRLIILLLLALLVTAYFWLPYLLDHAYINRSVWEDPGKYDAYGDAWTLTALVRGELFDYGRFPILTILAGAGLLVSLWHWREERYRLTVVFSVVWLMLYFGRPTWGVLLNLLPLSQDMHFHRLIGAVHLGGILLIGISLALPWQWVLTGKKVWQLVISATLTVLLLIPIFFERGAYLTKNVNWMRETQTAMQAEQTDYFNLVSTLQQLPAGRVYAGLGGNWGADYKVGAVPVYALLQSAGFDMVGYLYHALSLNADIQVLFDDQRPEQYNLFDVRYVVAPGSQAFPDFVQPVARFGQFQLYQVATTGYFDLVGSDSAFVGSKSEFFPAASRWLASDLPRVKEHPAIFISGKAIDYSNVFPLATAQEVIPLASMPNEQSRGQVIGEIIGKASYAVQVYVERQSYLMLKATYHPNWHASVDGNEVSTVMLMPSYIAVRVEPGFHQVLFEYHAQPWRFYLELVGLIVLFTIGFIERPRQVLKRELSRIPINHIHSWLQHSGSRIAGWYQSAAFAGILRIHLPYIGILMIFILLAGLPLFQLKIMSGHDSLEYLPRVVEFFENLKNGQLLPRWAPDLSAGYGQPLFIFNPPMYYYLSSIFHAIGFNLINSENLAIYLLLCLAGLGMYLLANDYFGQRGGLVAGVAYLFSPYLLVNLYVRHALADFTAMAFLPWAFWGLKRFTRKRAIGYHLIGPISIAMLLLSSNSVAVIATPALLLYAIWQGYSAHNRREFLSGILCLGLGLGLSAYFWLPALVERPYVHLERLLEGYLNYANHFVYPWQLISSPWGYGLSMLGSQDGMSFAIGPIYLGLIAIAIFILWRIRTLPTTTRRFGIFLIIILVLAVFFTSTPSKFVWDRLPLLQYLEFSWRFLTLVAFCTALFAGLPLALLTKNTRLSTPVAGLLIAGIFLTGFPHSKPESFLEVSEKGLTPDAIVKQSVSVSTVEEYQPIWVQGYYASSRNETLSLLEGEGYWQIDTALPTRYNFWVNAINDVRLRMNVTYFPGWTLYVDGTKSAIDYQNQYGLIEFELEPGQHHLRLIFMNTPIRNAGLVISLLAFLLILLTIGLDIKRTA